MTELGFLFDATKIAPAEPGYPIWEGLFPVYVYKTEAKPTTSGDGSNRLILHIKSLDGPSKGQDNIIGFNIWHVKPDVAERAKRELSSIAHVTGVMQFQNADQLLNRPFIAVFERQWRKYTNPQTGQTSDVEGSQYKDCRTQHGQTIKEAMAGQPPSQPYSPDQQKVGPSGGGAPAPAAGPAPAPQMGHTLASIPQQQPPAPPQPQQQQYAPGPQPGAPPQGFQQPGAAPQGGYAPPAMGGAPGGAPAMAPGGAQPGYNPGTPTAAYTPSAPQPQYGQQPAYNPAPQQPQQPQAFAPPGQGAAPGPGPWNPNAPR